MIKPKLLLYSTRLVLVQFWFYVFGFMVVMRQMQSQQAFNLRNLLLGTAHAQQCA